MSYRSARSIAFSASVIIALVLTFPRAGHASDTLSLGFDLFDPEAGSYVYVPGVGVVPVVGSPLGSFDFGFGMIATDNTDSVLERLGIVTTLAPSTTIAMRAMQMMSTDGSNLFFTLQAVPDSTGALALQGFTPDPHVGSTFTWDLDLNFDVRTGSFAGPIVQSFSRNVTTGPNPWSHTAPAGALMIPGVNFELAGSGDASQDFWTSCFRARGERTLFLFRPAGTVSCPEVGSVVLLGAGLAGLAGLKRKKTRA